MRAYLSASGPLRVNPEVRTDLLNPIFLSEKFPVAPVDTRLTISEPEIP